MKNGYTGRPIYSFFKQDDDRNYAIRHFGLAAQKCLTTTYGIEWETPPTPAEKQTARNTLLQQHQIPAHHRLLLFNGSFNYLPNLNGLRHIINLINPALQGIADFEYTILILRKRYSGSIYQSTIPQYPVCRFCSRHLPVLYRGRCFPQSRSRRRWDQDQAG